MTYAMVGRRARRPGLFVSFAALVVSSVLAGCNGGMSTQEAAVQCDIEARNKPTVTGDAYQACISCFEACGNECKAQDTNPETYACEE